MIYIKELPYEIVGSGWANFRICRAELPAGNSGTEASTADPRWNSFFSETSVLLLGFSTSWMRPIHIIEDNLLHLKSTDYKY